jgi:hypothetical protein
MDDSLLKPAAGVAVTAAEPAETAAQELNKRVLLRVEVTHPILTPHISARSGH